MRWGEKSIQNHKKELEQTEIVRTLEEKQYENNKCIASTSKPLLLPIPPPPPPLPSRCLQITLNLCLFSWLLLLYYCCVRVRARFCIVLPFGTVVVAAVAPTRVAAAAVVTKTQRKIEVESTKK